MSENCTKAYAVHQVRYDDSQACEWLLVQDISNASNILSDSRCCSQLTLGFSRGKRSSDSFGNWLIFPTILSRCRFLCQCTFISLIVLVADNSSRYWVSKARHRSSPQATLLSILHFSSALPASVSRLSSVIYLPCLTMLINETVCPNSFWQPSIPEKGSKMRVRASILPLPVMCPSP